MIRTAGWRPWMSGAVGSMPSLTRSLSPASRRRRRFASSWISTARSRSRFQMSLGPLMLEPGLLGVEEGRRIVRDDQGEDQLGGRPDGTDEGRTEHRLADHIVDLDLGPVGRSLDRLRGSQQEAQRKAAPGQGRYHADAGAVP